MTQLEKLHVVFADIKQGKSLFECKEYCDRPVPSPKPDERIEEVKR